MHGKGRLPLLVIDTDPGIDDAVALALALASPEVRVARVVTVFGNAALPTVTRNARHVLALAGRTDVPVLAGSDRPLLRAADLDFGRHGPEGVGYAAVPAPPPVTGSQQALLEALAECPPGAATLVTLGPLTNLAHALQANAALVRSRVRDHLAMAGGTTGSDSSPAVADFNVEADPRAAAMVLAAALPTRLVPLDVTGQVRVGAPVVEGDDTGRTPLGAWLGEALRFSLARAADSGRSACPIHDAVVVAGAIEPRVLDFTPRRLKIGRPDTPFRGMLLDDPTGHAVQVARAVDVPSVRRLLSRVLPIEAESEPGGR